MYERLASLDDSVLKVARVEKREDFRWQNEGYVIFSGTGNLMRKCEDIIGLENELGQLNSDFQYIEKPFNFVHNGQRMRYVPLGPLSTRFLSWMLSWR